MIVDNIHQENEKLKLENAALKKANEDALEQCVIAKETIRLLWRVNALLYDYHNDRD